MKPLMPPPLVVPPAFGHMNSYRGRPIQVSGGNAPPPTHTVPPPPHTVPPPPHTVPPPTCGSVPPPESSLGK